MISPTSEADVIQAIKGCAAEGRRIRLRGGGVSALAGSRDALGLSLAGLTGLVEHRPNDLVATARAGTRLEELEDELRTLRRRFPLRPHDRDGAGTLGGAFAAAADGLTATLARRTRDVLLGARVVLGGGDVAQVGARVVKSVAGFDVCKALVGSRGTLGAITEVTFRVEAIPDVTMTCSATFDDVAAVQSAVRAADALALAPTGLVVATGVGRDATQVHVLVEGPAAAVAAAVRALADSGFTPQGDAAWQWRELTAAAAAPPADGVHRVTGPCSRADPAASAPQGATSFIADVTRGRFVAQVAGQPAASRAVRPLYERVRAAFDPDGRWEPGRGPGAA